MTARILVVCTANICRSPLAEQLLQAYLDRYAPEVEVEVTSAGTHGRPGDRAATGMRDIAEQWGLDLSAHRANRIDASLVLSHQLVLTMEDAHRSSVARLGRVLTARTFMLTELAAIIAAPAPTVAPDDHALDDHAEHGDGRSAEASVDRDADGDHDDGRSAEPTVDRDAHGGQYTGQADDLTPEVRLRRAVTAWHAKRARIATAAQDVTDPYGGPTQGYRDTAWELADLVERLGPTLADVLTGAQRTSDA